MSKKSPTIQKRIFNIDKESKKFYPNNPVLHPSDTGIPEHHTIKPVKNSCVIEHRCVQLISAVAA